MPIFHTNGTSNANNILFGVLFFCESSVLAFKNFFCSKIFRQSNFSLFFLYSLIANVSRKQCLEGTSEITGPKCNKGPICNNILTQRNKGPIRYKIWTQA